MFKNFSSRKLTDIAYQGIFFLFVFGVFLYSGYQVLTYFFPLFNFDLKSLFSPIF